MAAFAWKRGFWLTDSISESSNCVNFNQAALQAVLKPDIKRTSKTNTRTLRLCVRFKYASFYRRFQSFQSLFGLLFSLVSIAVWIYFNRLQNSATLELNYFVFETFYVLPFFWHPRVAPCLINLILSKGLFD